MNMRCPICENTENWKNVDEFRHKPMGMHLCMVCGFVSYPKIVKETEELTEYYREEYRDVPSVQNVFAGQRKLHYHNEFLADTIKGWISEKFENPVVCEIGAAFGMFLSWIKSQVPKASISGTELTLSFRRNAWHEYGIALTEEMDFSKKYDLIASYKVAEHIPNIDKELRKYAEALNEKGLLYIGVPCWFDCMNNFGMSGFNIEYYYHKNHINAWTRKLFETLLKKCGLEVIKENHVFYDSTYLCKRNDKLMEFAPVYEDPADIIDRMDRIKKASVAFDSSQFDQAIAHWPNFPEAQISRYESQRLKFHQEGFEGLNENLLKPMIKACPDTAQVRMFSGDISMRYSQWAVAIEYLYQGLSMRPSDPAALIALGHCFRAMADASKDEKEKLKFFTEARNVTRFLKTTSLQTQHEAITWILNDNARIPMPSEKPGPEAL